jgi:Arc/MetJ-type ribon-helix-helix transcriptional regulator
VKLSTYSRIDARIPNKDLDFIDRLIASGVFKNRSTFIRYAVTEAKSKYTNEPTLSNLDQRQNRQQARLDQLERELRIIRKALDEIEKGNG